jgi:hypothetical protein
MLRASCRSAETAINLTAAHSGQQAAARQQSQPCTSDGTGQVTVNNICCTSGDRKAFHVLQELPFQRPSEIRLQTTTFLPFTGLLHMARWFVGACRLGLIVGTARPVWCVAER